MASNYVSGLRATLEAFDEMTDKEGNKWKRQSMTRAGREAMKIVVRQAKTNAPIGKTKILRSKLTLKSSFRPRRRKGAQLDVYTTYGKSFETAFRKKRPNEKVARYPYIIEAGWRGNKHRPKGIKSNPFQKEALTQKSNVVKAKFGRMLDRFLKIHGDNVGRRSVAKAEREHKMMMNSAFYRGAR